MIVAAAWAWAIAGIVAFLFLGVLVAVVLGAVGMPGDFLRRRRTPEGEVVAGVETPAEVPERTAEETAAEAERLERERDA
ncbi:MAG TPA: hypothetical protein VK874_08665 [Gaiellaceae bacterium]|nr:hypothetical protein [Gaiellaceae bacterium]